jgi:hypothetical protein
VGFLYKRTAYKAEGNKTEIKGSGLRELNGLKRGNEIKCDPFFNILI